MKKPKRFNVGDRVRLTGEFLRNTGQFTGAPGTSRWLIVDCKCDACVHGDFVAVNEPHMCQSDPTGYEDILVEERPKWKHIHPANLEKSRI